MKMAILMILLTGCVHTSVRSVMGPDGEAVFEASCNGNHGTFGDCMQVASQICEGPYEVMDKDSSVGVGSYNGDVFSKVHRQMLFRCQEEAE